MSKTEIVEELNDLCEILVEKTACSRIRDDTVEIQKKFANLVTLAQGKLHISFYFSYIL